MVPSELLERHRSQITADTTARTTAAMPLLKSGVEHAALRPGRNTLGGRGPDALPVAGLAFQPPVATMSDELMTTRQPSSESAGGS